MKNQTSPSGPEIVPLQYSIISLRARSDISAFRWVSQLIWRIEELRKKKLSEESELDPWTLFLNAMRAPMTRDRYKTRVAKFFNFIGIQKSRHMVRGIRNYAYRRIKLKRK